MAAQEWTPIIQYILNRLKEKSTWLGIGSVLTSMGFVLKPDQWQAIMAFGMGIPGLVAVFLPSYVDEKNITATDKPTDLSKSMEKKQ